jgi:hypothetical protein
MDRVMNKEFYYMAVEWAEAGAADARCHEPDVGVFANEEYAGYLLTLPDARESLRNIRLLAAREAHKANDPESPWHHVLRFCAEGGERGSILR